MLVFLSTDRLQLLLALVCALTGTPWGVGAALLVLAMLGTRRWSGRVDRPSVPTRRRILSAPQETHPLDPARGHRERAART